MPTGEVFKKDVPQAQQKLGQILCTDGEIIPFFNTENLDVGEPVIFDIIRTRVSVKADVKGQKYNYEGMMPVGILPKDFVVDKKNPTKRWPSELQARWKEEWAEFKDDQEVNSRLSGNLRTSVCRHPHCD